MYPRSSETSNPQNRMEAEGLSFVVGSKAKSQSASATLLYAGKREASNHQHHAQPNISEAPVVSARVLPSQVLGVSGPNSSVITPLDEDTVKHLPSATSGRDRTVLEPVVLQTDNSVTFAVPEFYPTHLTGSPRTENANRIHFNHDQHDTGNHTEFQDFTFTTRGLEKISPNVSATSNPGHAWSNNELVFTIDEGKHVEHRTSFLGATQSVIEASIAKYFWAHAGRDVLGNDRIVFSVTMPLSCVTALMWYVPFLRRKGVPSVLPSNFHSSSVPIDRLDVITDLSASNDGACHVETNEASRTDWSTMHPAYSVDIGGSMVPESNPKNARFPHEDRLARNGVSSFLSAHGLSIRTPDRGQEPISPPRVQEQPFRFLCGGALTLNQALLTIVFVLWVVALPPVLYYSTRSSAVTLGVALGVTVLAVLVSQIARIVLLPMLTPISGPSRWLQRSRAEYVSEIFVLLQLCLLAFHGHGLRENLLARYGLLLFLHDFFGELTPVRVSGNQCPSPPSGTVGVAITYIVCIGMIVFVPSMLSLIPPHWKNVRNSFCVVVNSATVWSVSFVLTSWRPLIATQFTATNRFTHPDYSGCFYVYHWLSIIAVSIHMIYTTTLTSSRNHAWYMLNVNTVTLLAVLTEPTSSLGLGILIPYCILFLCSLINPYRTFWYDPFRLIIVVVLFMVVWFATITTWVMWILWWGWLLIVGGICCLNFSIASCLILHFRSASARGMSLRSHSNSGFPDILSTLRNIPTNTVQRYVTGRGGGVVSQGPENSHSKPYRGSLHPHPVVDLRSPTLSHLSNTTHSLPESTMNRDEENASTLSELRNTNKPFVSSATMHADGSPSISASPSPYYPNAPAVMALLSPDESSTSPGPAVTQSMRASHSPAIASTARFRSTDSTASINSSPEIYEDPLREGSGSLHRNEKESNFSSAPMRTGNEQKNESQEDLLAKTTHPGEDPVEQAKSPSLLSNEVVSNSASGSQESVFPDETDPTALGANAVCWDANDNQENASLYCPGGYHPTKPGELFNGRYLAIQKLGWGEFSIVWLARDQQLASTNKSMSPLVALKISRANDMYQSSSLSEINICTKIREIADSIPSESDPAKLVSCVMRMHDSFYHTGPNGRHLVAVLECLGANLLSLMTETNFSGLSPEIVKFLMYQILSGLAFLHEHVYLTHADLKPENVLLCFNPHILSGGTVDSTATLPTPLTAHNRSFSERFRVKVSDLGSARIVPPTSPHTLRSFSSGGVTAPQRNPSLWRPTVMQTREYRAPEVILGYVDGFGPAMDVWSAACMTFELLTGDYLFDPKAQVESQEEQDMLHLNLAMQLMGPIPKNIVRKSAHAASFYRPNGAFLQRLLPRTTLEMHLINKYQFPRGEAREVADFLTPMLALDPEKRVTAKNQLTHPWIRFSAKHLAL